MIHFFINGIFLFVFLYTKGYKLAKNYHTTMLFISLVDLLYLTLCRDYVMWSYEADKVKYELIIELLYAFFLLPITAFLFLYFCPKLKERLKFFTHFLLWETGYILVEALLVKNNYIKYDNGWNIRWSILFVFVMFPVLFIHKKKPIFAYLISFIIICFLVWHFQVPILSNI